MIKTVEITGADSCKEVNPVIHPSLIKSPCLIPPDVFNKRLQEWRQREDARQEYKITNTVLLDEANGGLSYGAMNFCNIGDKVEADCNEETKTCTIV